MTAVAKKPKPNPVIGVGQPGLIRLNLFGRIVDEVFGTMPYLVGSAARGKQWRDVDVRLILTDEEYRQWCGEPARPEWVNPRWSGLCLAFATLGREMTGLPVDFQIQTMAMANELFGGEVRVPLGLALASGARP